MGKGMMVKRRFLILLSVSFLATPMDLAVYAADHYNLEENLPTQLEDSLPTAFRNREIQTRFKYEHTDDGNERLIAAPVLEVGILPNTELEYEVPFQMGDAEDKGLSDMSLGLLYNFNQETRFIPSVALAGKGIFATSDDNEGFDSEVKAIVSKTIPYTSVFQRIHVNGAWLHNSENNSQERDNRYKIVAGFDRRLGPDAIVILDYVREQQEEKDKDANLIETGMRYQFNPLTVVSAGISVGVGEESPDVGFTVNIQRSF
jgi:hypothetical protein